MNNNALDIYLSFPLPPHLEEEYNKLIKFCGSVEHTEEAFEIDFSCGDGKYLPDIEDDDQELEKYDGNVCTHSLPRHRSDGKVFKPNKSYRFSAKYLEKHEELVYYLNNKETFRKWVG